MTTPLSGDVIARLERYTEELARWGSRINLVGSTASEALSVHVGDALAARDALPRDATVADLGTGAGLPGVPLAIARPDCRFVLVESRERRVHFLRHVCRVLDLGCEVWRQRIEDGPGAAPFDVATLRAVGPAKDVLRLAASWVQPSGEVWLWTRETAEACGVSEADELEIPPAAQRGWILRVPVHAIPRGTPSG